MDGLQSIAAWKEFNNNFSSKYFDILANKLVKRCSSFTKVEFFSSPHILFYGNDISLLKLYSLEVIKRVLGANIKPKQNSYELSWNNNKYVCPYRYSDYHIEIDMNEIKSAEKQFLSEFIFNHIASIKNIRQEKHIILMHNIDTMSEQSMFSLRRPLEVLGSNVMFLFTTSSLTKIEDAIKSRCMQIRSNIEESALISFFEVLAEDLKIDNQIEIDPSNGLVYCLLELSNGNVENKVETSIRSFVHQLIKEKNILTACESIRAFGFKLLHFNVPLSTIMRTTIRALCEEKKFKKHIHHIVTLAASLEHSSKTMSKANLILERFFIEIFKLSS